MNALPGPRSGLPGLTVEHAFATDAQALLADPRTLAVLGFGAAPETGWTVDPRYLRVPLQSLDQPFAFEVWRSDTPVVHGRQDGIAHAGNSELQFGWLEVEETADGILPVAEQVYARLDAFLRNSGYPHLLRIWNYFDAITEGDGDGERYRQFCVGRVRGLGAVDTRQLPAATAIGQRDGRRTLQVYWLATRAPGLPMENPRQVSAWHYPREYGPQSPSFARAMLPPPGHAELPLFLSGTASIVGHASQHVGSLDAQIDETLANLDSLITAARVRQSSLPAHLDASSRLKVYVRDAADAEQVARRLDERLDPAVPRILLHADVCRRELRVEIEGMHGVRT